MGWNPKKEAEKAARKVAEKIVKQVLEPVGNRIKRECNDLGDSIRGSLRKRGREMEGLIDEAADKAEGRLRGLGNEIEDGLTEKLPELVEDVVQELAQAASERSIKEALDNACDVIEVMAPSNFTLIFGVELALVVQGEVTVSVAFPNPTAKLTEMRRWANSPPSGRAQIVECIRDFGPESLGAEFKVSGNGLAVEWDGDDKYDRIDAFLEKHGVD